jgi:hypothetical protein
MERIGRSIAAKQEKEPQPPTKILQFPLPFEEDTRAVSNSLARGSLFAAVKDRQYFKQYVIVGEVDGVKIEFAGEQLNQDDHDTLLQNLSQWQIIKPLAWIFAKL